MEPNEQNEENLEANLVDSVADKNLTNILADVSEVFSDQFLEGPIKEIPIFGILVKIYGAQKDIRNRFFAKKVLLFLKNLSKIDLERRKNFKEKLREEKKLREFGETITILLEKADNMNKPLIIANLIVALIDEKVDYNTAMLLCQIVSRIFFHDLTALVSFENGVPTDDKRLIAERLLSAGLVSLTGIDGGEITHRGSGGMGYARNQLAEKLIKYGQIPKAKES
jgi:hypothetical protein